jgi:hypothetical protein
MGRQREKERRTEEANVIRHRGERKKVIERRREEEREKRRGRTQTKK